MANDPFKIPSLDYIERLNRMIDPSYLRALRKHADMAGQMNRSLKAYRLPASLQAIVERESKIWKSLELAVKPDVIASMRSFEKLQLAKGSWETSTARLLQQMECFQLPKTYPYLAQRLLAPSVAFTEFAQATFERIDDATSEEVASALEASLTTAEGQLLEAADLVGELGYQPGEVDIERPTPELNHFWRQQTEFLALVPVVPRVEPHLLQGHSPSAALFEKGRRIGQLIVEVNRARRLRGEADIFTPTNTLLEAVNFLPWIQVVDKRSLGHLVDQLYLSLYEGAGKDKLRFLQEHGGYLTGGDADVMWTIKHLRNKLLRHDPDHGDARGVSKSWADLRQALLKLGFDHLPTNIPEYLMLQQRLMDAVEAFLERLLTQVNTRPQHSSD